MKDRRGSVPAPKRWRSLLRADLSVRSDSRCTENLSYLRNPVWWAGMSTLILGEVANFAAYTFAPPVLVTPLGALSVLAGAILAYFLLNERLGHLGRVGCAVCLIGSVIIVLHAPDDRNHRRFPRIRVKARCVSRSKYKLTWPCAQRSS
ncbi:magnesium transporter NIPA-domain-containing protein [Mycena albidolilacea]|uniref:Magnesium transporter NIPA-domain-containing protein n=1 Tax=Mycena albidolilacea TaxID=1033008 RepID=A0AAD6ZHQ0_9AGAR|nr:magnesium transporter NIPA-domain-containing protein [Mycena albidolilacea]